MKGVISVDQLYSGLKGFFIFAVVVLILLMAVKAVYGGSGPDIIAALVKSVSTAFG